MNQSLVTSARGKLPDAPRVWHRFISILSYSLLALVLAGVLFSDYFASSYKAGWLSSIAIEIRAACRDPGTQWMVFLCAGIYFVTFLLLAKRTRNPPLSLPRAGTARIGDPDVWLCALLLIVTVSYAFDYRSASASLQPLLLIVGAASGKGAAMWALWRKSERENRIEQKETKTTKSSTLFPSLSFVQSFRIKWILGVLVLLFAACALWQPEMMMQFQYRGVRRWSGAWENPNLYGLLMAVGFALAVGLLTAESAKDAEKGTSPRPSPHCSQTRNAEREKSLRSLPSLRLKKFWFVVRGLLPFIAACLCGYGLLRSYSRGAWLGAGIGLGYVVWQLIKGTRHPSGGEGELPLHRWNVSRFNSFLSHNKLSLFVIFVSVLVILFWQFKNTDWPPARRLFSVGNVNDFSWRNRVTTWEGALQMMADKPFAGFGWGNAEQAYQNEYRARRLEEAAAIKMNDYFMLGISAGVPALLCFGIFVWLSLIGNNEFKTETGWKRCPTMICRAGALVLLVAFWFDGGLFKLPTAALFWLLLELGALKFIPDFEDAC